MLRQGANAGKLQFRWMLRCEQFRQRSGGSFLRTKRQQARRRQPRRDRRLGVLDDRRKLLEVREHLLDGFLQCRWRLFPQAAKPSIAVL